MKKQTTLGIDIDLTLLSCHSFIYALASKFHIAGNCKKLKYKEIDKDFVGKPNLILKNALSFYNPAKYYALPNAVETINKLYDSGVKIVFLSRRPASKAWVGTLTTFLKANGVKYDKLILGCNNKAQYCKQNNIDYHIDDLIYNCINVQSVGVTAINYQQKPILKNQVLCKKFNIKNVQKWGEVLDIVSPMTIKQENNVCEENQSQTSPKITSVILKSFEDNLGKLKQDDFSLGDCFNEENVSIL